MREIFCFEDMKQRSRCPSHIKEHQLYTLSRNQSLHHSLHHSAFHPHSTCSQAHDHRGILTSSTPNAKLAPAVAAPAPEAAITWQGTGMIIGRWDGGDVDAWKKNLSTGLEISSVKCMELEWMNSEKYFIYSPIASLEVPKQITWDQNLFDSYGNFKFDILCSQTPMKPNLHPDVLPLDWAAAT